MTKRFVSHELPLKGLQLIERAPLVDHRGFLQRLYCNKSFAEMGIAESIVQMNHTLTHSVGSVRGMHFQHAPYAEVKVVSCLRGCVFDVAVDLRQNSPTFLKWHGVVLSAELNNSLLIPKGFAHGYQTLVNDCELLYFHTNEYQSSAESGVSPLDPSIGIVWPLTVTEMSERDKNHPRVATNFKGLAHEM